MGSAGPRLKHGDSLRKEMFVLEEHKQRKVERARGGHKPLNSYIFLQMGDMY